MSADLNRKPHHCRWRASALLAAIIGAAPAGVAAAPRLTTLYSFSGHADGSNPQPSVISGPDGALFGATTGIGTGLPGTVYELLPLTGGGTAWTLKTLYHFTGGADGSEPGNLVADKDGNLFGEASAGGSTACSGGCGTIFELSPPASGKDKWTETTLYSFTGGADGSYPYYGLAKDGDGRLLGFADGGGKCAGCGTVFRLTPPAAGGADWSETTLYAFAGGTGGAAPLGVPLFGKDGSIFGATAIGGNVTAALCTTDIDGCGTVFQLIPPSSKTGVWTMTQLRRFNGKDAGEPLASLTADASGNLFGTAIQGGDLTDCTDAGYPPGCGTVFELTPPPEGSTVWGHSVVWAFTAEHGGDYPLTDALLPDADGFITTVEGDGIATFGTIEQFTPPAEGHKKWTATTIYTFSGGADGGFPAAALLHRGNAYFGTTVEGGNSCVHIGGCGTIFRLSP